MIDRTVARKALRYAVLAVGVIALVSYGSTLTSRYQTLRRSLEGLGGVKLLDSREEVIYRLGRPTYVVAPLDPSEGFFPGRRIFYTSLPREDKDALPAGSKIQDFPGWTYDKTPRNAQVDLEFSPSGEVVSVGWYSDSQDPMDWGPVAGIHNGDSEEVVLDLMGRPTSSSLDGTTKTLHYRDLGLEFTLVKGRAYRAILHARQLTNWAVFKKFLRTLT